MQWLTIKLSLKRLVLKRGTWNLRFKINFNFKTNLTIDEKNDNARLL